MTANPSQNASSKDRLRVRSVVIGVTLAVLLCAITPFNNAYRAATPLGGGHFPLAPFFIIFWLTIVMAVAKKVFRGWMPLSGRDLLVVWILMVLVSGVAYTGLVRTFFINLTAPYQFATVGNHWQEILHPLLPKAWYPLNSDAVLLLYEGFPSGYRMSWWEVFSNIPWNAWIVPLLVWGLFVFLCYFVLLCLVNLLSRQWVDNERMNFPLLRVPILLEEALDNDGLWHFLTDKYFLVGLFFPLFLHTLGGLHYYFPSVPAIPTLILAGPYFPKYGLFSGFVKLKIYIYPAFIGFAFLCSRQISFSFWFFFLAGGLLTGFLGLMGYDIPASALGVTFGPTLARAEETQMIGAYGVFFIFILYLSRFHLAKVFRQSFFLKEPSPREWFSTRLSAWGFLLGSGLLVLWCHYFGLPLLPAFLMIGACFMVMLVATRAICQGGIAYFTLTAAPIDGLLALFGSRFFTTAGLLTAAVVQKVLFVDLRESLMPSLVHARKVTHKMRNRRILVSGILLTLALAITVSFVAMLGLCHKYGIRELQLDWATRTTLNVYENVRSLAQTPQEPSRWVSIFSAMGALVMFVLVVCYHRFYWWPIHPIGYLTAYSSAMRILWFSFFVGWLANTLCMRYGGVVLFGKVRNLFIGLIVADFLAGGVFALIGLFASGSYQVLPG